MPRIKKRMSERMVDQINVPVVPGLKRRVATVARKKPDKPTVTELAREYIERGVSTDEQAIVVSK